MNPFMAAERRRTFELAENAYRQALALSFPAPEYHPLLPYRALARCNGYAPKCR